MATKKELEFVIKAMAEGRGLEQINQDLVKTIFNARQLTAQQYEVVVKAIEQGKNLNQISSELRVLQQEERAVARTAYEAERAHQNLQGRMKALQGAMAQLGLGVSIQQLTQFANESRAVARAENDALGALRESAEGIDDYQRALELGRQATKGMASDQQLAASQAVLFGTGLATNAEQAAKLGSAGTILSEVFKSAGASEELYVRLLSSGSVQLYNNFGLTAQMVNEKQKEIEATTSLTGAEAKSQALKEILIAQAEKYQGALSAESVAAAQAAAAQANFMASFGNLVNSLDAATGATGLFTEAMNRLNEGAKAWQGIINVTGPALEEQTGAFSAALDVFFPYIDAVQTMIGVAETQTEAIFGTTEAIPPYVSSLNAMNIAAATAVAQTKQLTQAQQDLTAAANAQAGAFGGQRDEFGQGLMIEGLQAASQARLDYQAEQQRQQEQATREAERQSQRQAQAMTKAFSQVGGEISSSISSAVSGALGDLNEVWSGAANTDAANGPAMWARRIAAIAAGGLQDEWAQRINEMPAQLAGQSFMQPLIQAIQGGDDAGVRQQAQQLLANRTADLFDANMIAQQVEAKLRAQQVQQVLNDKVNALLGEKGLPAVEQITQQVGSVVETTGAAADSVGQGVTNVALSAEQAGAKIGASFKAAIPQIDILNERFRLMAGLIERVNVLAGQASGNIQGMNPPQAGLPNSADRAAGGPSPL